MAYYRSSACAASIAHLHLRQIRRVGCSGSRELERYASPLRDRARLPRIPLIIPHALQFRESNLTAESSLHRDVKGEERQIDGVHVFHGGEGFDGARGERLLLGPGQVRFLRLLQRLLERDEIRGKRLRLRIRRAPIAGAAKGAMVRPRSKR